MSDESTTATAITTTMCDDAKLNEGSVDVGPSELAAKDTTLEDMLAEQVATAIMNLYARENLAGAKRPPHITVYIGFKSVEEESTAPPSAVGEGTSSENDIEASDVPPPKRSCS